MLPSSDKNISKYCQILYDSKQPSVGKHWVNLYYPFWSHLVTIITSSEVATRNPNRTSLILCSHTCAMPLHLEWQWKHFWLKKIYFLAKQNIFLKRVHKNCQQQMLQGRGRKTTGSEGVLWPPLFSRVTIFYELEYRLG